MLDNWLLFQGIWESFGSVGHCESVGHFSHFNSKGHLSHPFNSEGHFGHDHFKQLGSFRSSLQQ